MLRKILCVSLVAVSIPLAGCSLIADFDHSKIKHETPDAGADTTPPPGHDAAIAMDAATKDAAVSDAGKDAEIGRAHV